MFGIPSWVAIVKPDAMQSAGLDLNALRNRHRFFDERIKVGLPIDNCDSPQRQPIGPSPALSLLGGVNTVDKRPANPEAKVVDPVAGGARVAERGAQVIWREVPGTAAVETDFAVAAFDPGRTIRRRAIVAVVEAILDPLKDIADHVMEAERIGLE